MHDATLIDHDETPAEPFDVPAGAAPQRALHDVAPTLLELLGEPVPAEMEGQSMLRPAAADGPEPSASRDASVTDTRAIPR